MMGVLLLLGMMNLAWMAIITAVMVAERVGRLGPRVAQAAAGGLMVAAVAVQQHLPGLG
jgi:predicted metal-binding membrane protein